jgi:hypothetical protein
MDELRYKRAKIIKDLMASPLFAEVIKAVTLDIAVQLLAESSAEQRTELYYESKALTRVVGRLQTIANEVTMIEHQNRSA